MNVNMVYLLLVVLRSTKYNIRTISDKKTKANLCVFGVSLIKRKCYFLPRRTEQKVTEGDRYQKMNTIPQRAL